eukprot:6484373-Amphidinium_carterae.1
MGKTGKRLALFRESWPFFQAFPHFKILGVVGVPNGSVRFAPHGGRDAQYAQPSSTSLLQCLSPEE